MGADTAALPLEARKPSVDALLQIQQIQREVIACNRCPRLRRHCEQVARVKRRAWLSWDYWGKPVPSFGDPLARLLIIGLAPGAHGANRTGRMFTGDRSGDFLYQALYTTGFASQAHSKARGDGLELRDAFITAAARCAPPDNKPSPQELRNCQPWLEAELAAMPRVKVVVALGRIAFDAYLSILAAHGVIASRSRFRFAHNALHRTAPGYPALISSYHPSQQNTSTGRLTPAMLQAVFARARKWIENGL